MTLSCGVVLVHDAVIWEGGVVLVHYAVIWAVWCGVGPGRCHLAVWWQMSPSSHSWWLGGG